MSGSTRNLRIAAVVFAALGALGMAVALFNVPRTSRLVMGGRTEGTVVAFQRVGRGRHLVVRYDGPDGEPIQFRSQVDRPRHVKIGEYVAVRYDPHEPEVAEVDSFNAIWGRVLFPAAVGLALATISLLLFVRVTVVRARRRKRRAPQPQPAG
jgi:hypothetical protein